MGSLPATRPPAPSFPPRGPLGRFENLYRRHYPIVQRYVRRRIGDAHAVEDVVAETFLVAFENHARYVDRGKPVQAWLYRLATSRIARHLRKARPEPSEVVLETAARDENDVRRDAVRDALAELPMKQQNVLALHHLEGLSLEEVARILRCRVGTVKSRLFRAREALRQALEREEWRP